MSKDTASTDSAAVQALQDRLLHAIRDKDAAAIVALHADGFVQYSLAPPLISTAANETGLNAWFATWDGPIAVEAHDRSVACGDDIAFCYSLNSMRGRKADGEAVSLWYRQTLCLRREGNAWRIVHEHESVPFYMDGSYRAAVDLNP